MENNDECKKAITLLFLLTCVMDSTAAATNFDG
jgi:hypothetical protein